MPLFSSRRRDIDRWHRSTSDVFLTRCETTLLHRPDASVPSDTWYWAGMAAVLEVGTIVDALSERSDSEVTRRDLWKSMNARDALSCMYAQFAYLAVEATAARDTETVTDALSQLRSLFDGQYQDAWLNRLAELHAAGRSRVMDGGSYFPSGAIWALMLGAYNGEYPQLPADSPHSDAELIERLDSVTPLSPWDTMSLHTWSLSRLTGLRDALFEYSPQQRGQELARLLRG